MLFQDGMLCKIVVCLLFKMEKYVYSAQNLLTDYNIFDKIYLLSVFRLKLLGNAILFKKAIEKQSAKMI